MKHRIPRILWAAVKRTCMVLGAFVLVSSVLSIYMASRIAGDITHPSLPKDMLLYVDLRAGVIERHDFSDFAGAFGGDEQPTELRMLVGAIDRAAEDPSVKGLYTRFGGASVSFANAQELRDAIERFRAAGKATYAFARSYDDLSSYYLASAHDEIWMQPVGGVTINGISAEMPFFRGVFEKIGIVPHFFKRKEYKTAYENFTDKEPSAANKEMLGDLLNDVKSRFVADVSDDGRVSEAALRKLVNKGVFTDAEAIKVKLVTHIGYYDAMLADMGDKIAGISNDAEGIPPVVPLKDYAYIKASERSAKRFAALGKDKRVALVYMVGPIVNESGSNVVAANDITPILEDLRVDKAVKAVIVRLDSPGGLPDASESILHGLKRLQAEGKIVIVSMGGVTASGGYWIASGADRIFAQDTTVTGSIGVVGGKFTGSELSDKLGVSWDRSLRWGDNAGMMSPVTPFSESESERMNTVMDGIYDAFITRVADGRGMSRGDVEAIAKGRVWSGKRAVEIGLVDQIGGLREAMDYTAQVLELSSWRDLEVQVYPRVLTPWEQLIDVLSMQASISPVFKEFTTMIGNMGGVISAAQVIGSGQNIYIYEPLRIE